MRSSFHTCVCMCKQKNRISRKAMKLARKTWILLWKFVDLSVDDDFPSKFPFDIRLSWGFVLRLCSTFVAFKSLTDWWILNKEQRTKVFFYTIFSGLVNHIKLVPSNYGQFSECLISFVNFKVVCWVRNGPVRYCLVWNIWLWEKARGDKTQYSNQTANIPIIVK